MGVMHHIVVSFDGDNDLGRLYIDGRLAAENNVMTHRLELLQTDLAMLGASLYHGDPSFHGRIAQFEIYDTALSTQEVLKLYKAGTIQGTAAANVSTRLATGQVSVWHLATWLGGAVLLLSFILLAVKLLWEWKQGSRTRE
jgi:hypothetical protein